MLNRKHLLSKQQLFFCRKVLNDNNGKKKKPTDFQQVSICKSGENRIRTCEPVLPATRFPGVPLQPLEHLSFNVLQIPWYFTYLLFASISLFICDCKITKKRANSKINRGIFSYFFSLKEFSMLDNSAEKALSTFSRCSMVVQL